MRLATIGIKGLMVGVAVVALSLFALSRLDFLALSMHVIWRGAEQFSNPLPKWIYYPRLAFWVIPFLTIAMVWPSRRASITWLGLCSAGTIMISWLFLRRPVQCMYGGVSFNIWPDHPLDLLITRISSLSNPLSGHMCYPSVWPCTPAQWADVFCLLAFLIIFSGKLY
jgi:hypothetical protein